jgi:hypothetical protein
MPGIHGAGFVANSVQKRRPNFFGGGGVLGRVRPLAGLRR